MSRGALEMISRMQQQELEIQGVIGTIYANIDQLCRSELVVCLPKLHKSLSSLLGKHFHSTKHLRRKLGEDHPMATMWRQRVDEVHEEANEAIRCLSIVLRNYNDDWWWATDEIEDNTSAQAVAASELRVAEDVLPAALQVQVTVKGNDAAANLPIGGVATVINTADADTATRSQDAQGGQQREKAQPVAGLQAADATQLANQVHVNTTIEASCASPHSPVGKVASGGHPATLEVAPRFQPAADVAQFNNRTAGTTPPAAKQVVATTVNPTELVGISASHRGQGSTRQSSTETALRYCEENNKSGELHVEAQAAASDTMQPALDQVYICSVKYNDAAYNLPVGYVTSGPQAAQQAESGEPHEEEHAAETETVQPALDQAAPAEAAAADTIKPAVVQVIVCSIELDDAASNLPVGYVPSGGTSRVDTGTATTHEDAPACALLSGVEHEASRAAGSLTATQVQAAEVGTASKLQADTALRPRVAPPEDGQQYEEAQPVAGLQAADATQQDTPRTAGTKPPAAEQVTMTTVISTELVGSSASQNGQGSPRQSSTETGHEAKSADTTKLKVKDESYNTKDTASDSPIGKPVPPTTLPSSGTALGLLDTLLARSRTVQRKLDRMTIPPADVKTVLARGPSMPAGQPVAILDKCLAQSQLLLQKMDKLSAKAKAKSLIPTLNAEVVLPTSPRQEQKVPTPQAQAALLASQQEVYQFPPLQAEILPAGQQEKYQCPILQAEVVLPASQQEEYQCPILQTEVVLPAGQQEVYQFPILQTEVLPASQQEEYQCPILQEELVLSTSQQEEHQLPTLKAKLVLSTSHRQFAPPTLATANEAAEADKPSHILVSCLAQASPTAQKRDNLSTSRHYYGHGPSHQKLDKTGGLPAPVQSAGTKGVNGHQNWKDDRFKGSILAQADTATQVWATGDIVADTDSPARRAAQENADSTQVRGLQELGCIDKSRHADLDADRGVSDPIAKQPDLDTDLQVLVGLDRGLEAGHRTLGHTDSFHRSSDPDKRNKVNKSKEYLSSLMMDHLPPCFSGSQPEWNQCWYDTSTRVDSEGSTVRVSMECIRSPTCINLHPAEKVGSTVVTERPRMVRVICRKAKKYNYAHLNPDAQLLQIRELSRQPYQEADCILLTTRQQADVLLTNLQADVLLTSKQADVLLTTLQADVLLTTKQADVLLTTLQADVLLTTLQADVLLTTPQTNVLLTTQQADVQLADCVLLSIQKPVVHRDSVLNHADDQVVLLSSQQEDISNGSLIHIVTCIGAAVTEAKIQVAPECCAGGVIISMQHPDLQSHSKSPAKATAAEDACSIPQSNKWRKFIITESEAEQVMGPATKIKSNNTMISDEKPNSVPTFSAAHDEDEVAVKHEEAVNSSLSSSTVETAGMVTSATSTSGEAASNSLGKRKFKTSILGGIEIHQVERVPEMETVIDKVGVEIIISDAVPDIELTSRAGSSNSPRTLSSEKQASDQESKDEAAPKKTKTQSTDQNNCNTYPNVEVCKLVSATQQAECGQLSIQQCLEESSILGAECSLLSIQQVKTNCQDIGPTRSVKITLEQHFCCTHFQAALSSVQHQNYQWAAMIGARSIAVCAMISILKQHEEAQAAAELQAADTMLPATVQVKVYTSKANDAAANLPTGKVTSGDAVTADAVIDADRATRTQAAPQAEAQAAAGPRATGSIQPATVQVQVCSVELKDAASNLPVGHVDSGGITDTASRPHDAPAEGGQQRKEAQPGAGLQAADTMQPATVQVKVCKVKTNCTAANLPLGNVASGGVTVDADTATGPQDAPQVEAQAAAGLQAADSMQPATELKDAVSNLPVANVASGGIEVDTDIKPKAAPSESERLCAAAHAAAADTMQPVVQVQVCTAELNDTASNLLPGSIITRSKPSQLLDSSSMQATQASQILDRCMARASAAAKKLDRLSASQAIDGKPALAGIHPTNLTLQSPGAQLDSVLARAASLLGKLDNLSSRVSGTRELDRIQGQVAYHLSSSSMSPTVGLVTSSEHPVETVGSTDRQIALPVVEDHKGEQDYLRHMPEKGAHTTNKEATFQPMEEPMQFTTVSMVSEATCQKAERLTTVSMLSEVTGRKAEQLRTVSMVSEVTGQKAEQLTTVPMVSEVTKLQFTTKPIAREVVWATCQHAEQQGQLTTMKDRGLIQVSYQDRSTQTINCRVSDPVAIQLDLGCDLQERDSADRDKHAGLQTGHQVLDHTSHYHSSNVPDKRNKVNEQREYLTSLMLEQVPLCSSGRQPEQKKHWDDTSTIVISVGSTATTSTGSQAAGFKQSERLKVQICTMDTNDASPHSPVNAGSRQLAGSIDREACTQSTGQNMQSTYIRNEVSKHDFAEQPADCVLLPIQRRDCHRLPINQTDCNLQHIEEADCVRQHIQETNSVLLSNQHTACVLLIIQQLVTHHSSVLNSNDDLVVLHFSQQEARQTDGSNGSLAQLFTGLPHHHLHPQVIEEVSEDSTVLPSVHGGVLALALEECSRDTEGLQKAETSFSPAKLLSQQMPAKPIQVQVSKTGRNDTAIILPIGHGKLKEKHTVGVTHSPRHKYLHQSHVQQIGALPESAELDEAVHTFKISRVAWQLMQTSGSVAAGIRKQSLPAGSQDKEPFIIQGWCDISNKADSVGSTVESSADRVSSACISSLIMNGGNSPSIATTTTLLCTEEKEDHTEIAAITRTAEKAQLTVQCSLAAPKLRLTVRAASSQAEDSVHSQSSTQLEEYTVAEIGSQTPAEAVTDTKLRPNAYIKKQKPLATVQREHSSLKHQLLFSEPEKRVKALRNIETESYGNAHQVIELEHRAAHHPSQEHYPLRVSQVLEQENRDEKLLTSKEEVDLTNMGSIEGLIDQEEGQDVHQQQQGSPVWPDEVEHEVNTCPVVCSEHQSDEKTERESLDQDDRAKPCKGRMSVVTSTADQADDPNGSEAVEPDMRSATRGIIPNLEASSRETVPALSVCTVRRPGSAVDLKDEICAQDKGVQAQQLEVERLESIPANPAVVHGDVQVDVVHDGHGGTGRSVEQCTQHVRPHHPCQEAIQGDSEPAVHDGTIGSMEVVDGWVQAEVGHESHPPHPQFDLHMLAQMAMTCIISLHYCRKVTTLSSSNVAVTKLITSPASGKVNLLSSFMNEAINGSSMSQGVATSRLCDTVHGQGHHHQHDQGHQLLPDDEAGPVQQVYPSTISIGWAEKGCTSANSMDCSSLLYNKVEDYAVAHALLHIAREEVGSCQDILYRHVLEPQLLQGRIQASFLFILKQKLTRYFPETGPDHEDCHHARVPQSPALQGHHHHRCRDVQREQGQGPET